MCFGILVRSGRYFAQRSSPVPSMSLQVTSSVECSFLVTGSFPLIIILRKISIGLSFLLYRSSAATENKQFIAQLMRIHIVTPKDPIQLAILPKVKVGRGIPTFSPGTEIPVNLGANIYYVLRLP